MDYEGSFYHNTPPSLNLEHGSQSRGSSSSSSSSSSAQLLSPLQVSAATDWTSQPFFRYDGQGVDYKPSLIPDQSTNNNGQTAYGMLGQQQSNQATDNVNQATCPGGAGGVPQNPFQNMSTFDVEAFINQSNQADKLYSVLGYGNFSTNFNNAFATYNTAPPATVYPQQLDNPQQLDTLFKRSPSPLNEIEEFSPSGPSSASPEVEAKPTRQQRRASDGSLMKPGKTHNRRSSVLLPMEEKMMRAQATEGLSKQDRRRVQNKLAQRAFRARTKVVDNEVQNRLDHLEKTKEAQAERIDQLSELVTRLQTENTCLKAQKFAEARSP